MGAQRIGRGSCQVTAFATSTENDAELPTHTVRIGG